MFILELEKKNNMQVNVYECGAQWCETEKIWDFFFKLRTSDKCIGEKQQGKEIMKWDRKSDNYTLDF